MTASTHAVVARSRRFRCHAGSERRARFPTARCAPPETVIAHGWRSSSLSPAHVERVENAASSSARQTGKSAHECVFLDGGDHRDLFRCGDGDGRLSACHGRTRRDFDTMGDRPAQRTGDLDPRPFLLGFGELSVLCDQVRE